MTFVTRQPPPPLDRYIRSLWSGLDARFQIIDTAEQEHVIGVSFHPAGTVGFFREPAHEFNGPEVSVDALWGMREAARLREALLEARTPDAALDARNAR